MNVDRTTARPLLMDFKRVAVVPSECDLDSMAAEMTTANAATETEYAQVRETYGTDVTEVRRIRVPPRELRMATYKPRMRPRDRVASRGSVPCRLPAWPCSAVTLELERDPCNPHEHSDTQVL